MGINFSWTNPAYLTTTGIVLLKVFCNVTGKLSPQAANQSIKHGWCNTEKYNVNAILMWIFSFFLLNKDVVVRF